tara:strand:+ start:163 stop:588 length:426 start_codon:yes stop_codon:yes gene_type:complete
LLRDLAKKYKEILVYHDHQPLLLFWAVSDLFNNQVLWTTLSFWQEQGQPDTYFLYMAYLFISLGILFTLNRVEWCVKFVFGYLMLHIFSTIRFLVSLYLEPDLEFELFIVKNLTITLVYFILWVWIYTKMKTEAVHRKING